MCEDAGRARRLEHSSSHIQKTYCRKQQQGKSQRARKESAGKREWGEKGRDRQRKEGKRREGHAQKEAKRRAEESWNQRTIKLMQGMGGKEKGARIK